MDAVATDTAATGAALPKSPSRASFGSSSAADATLCGPAEAPGAAAAEAACAHSREIALVDLSPDELDIARELGARAPETIECLRINRCRMDGGAFAALVDVLCAHALPRLHTVDISQNQVGGAAGGAALARLLAHARGVRTLALGWNQLALADLRALVAPGAPAYGIQHLDLRANPLGAPLQARGRRSRTPPAAGDGDAWVGGLVAAMPRLTHVLLAQATVDDATLVALLHALTGPRARLEYVGLEWLGLGGRLATVRSIMSRLAPADLAGRALPLHLNLASNSLGDSGVKIIAESGAMLTGLTLACNFITERGTRALAAWLPRSGLAMLELSDNHFGDQGIASLVAVDAARAPPAPPYTAITSLGLNSCCLSDASLRMLSDALLCGWAPLASLRILRNSRISPGARVPL